MDRALICQVAQFTNSKGTMMTRSRVARLAVATAVASGGTTLAFDVGVASALPTGCTVYVGSQTTSTYCSGGTGQHRARHFCGSGTGGGFQYGAWTAPANFSTAGSCFQTISNRAIELRN